MSVFCRHILFYLHRVLRDTFVQNRQFYGGDEITEIVGFSSSFAFYVLLDVSLFFIVAVILIYIILFISDGSVIVKFKHVENASKGASPAFV